MVFRKTENILQETRAKTRIQGKDHMCLACPSALVPGPCLEYDCSINTCMDQRIRWKVYNLGLVITFDSSGPNFNTCQNY